jgi:hypothetical protein
MWGTDWDTGEKRPLPATISDLAKALDESKFFGYMDPPRVTLLLDISEFGLDPANQDKPVDGIGLVVGPRFYMKYLGKVWFVLFMPGKRDGIRGYSAKVEEDEEEDYDEGNEEEDYDKGWEKVAAKDRALAEAFDPKLCDEVSRFGEIMMLLAKGKIAGWTGSTLKSDLEQAQLVKAIMTLPRDHPAYVGLAQSFFKSI